MCTTLHGSDDDNDLFLYLFIFFLYLHKHGCQITTHAFIHPWLRSVPRSADIEIALVLASFRAQRLLISFSSFLVMEIGFEEGCGHF